MSTTAWAAGDATATNGVAKITHANGTTDYYSTIYKANEDAVDGETVVLLKDVQLTEDGSWYYNNYNTGCIWVRQCVSFNLNGHTITGTDHGSNVNSLAVDYVFLYMHDQVSNLPRLSGRVYNGTIYCHKIGVYAADLSDVVVDHLTITQTTPSNWTLTPSEFRQVALAVSDQGTLTVNGGTYTGNYCAAYIYTSGGILTINGGTFEGTKIHGTHNEHLALEVDGTSQRTESMWNTRNTFAYVRGGKFIGKMKMAAYNNVPYTGFYISGGMFSENPNDFKTFDGTTHSDWPLHIISSKSIESNTDATTSAQYPYIFPAAQVGGIKYSSFAYALDAVSGSAQTTIQMLDNDTIGAAGSSIEIPAGKNIVLDLNGKSFIANACGGDDEGVSPVITVNPGATLTVQNGTITTSKYKFNETSMPYWDYKTAVITNKGTLNIAGGTFNNTSAHGDIIAIENRATQTANDVTFNMTGGTIQAGGIWTNDQIGGGKLKVNVSNANATVNGPLNLAGTDAAAYAFSAGTYNCSNLKLAYNSANTKPYATISGGKWDVTAKEVEENTDRANSLLISGGVFKTAATTALGIDYLKQYGAWIENSDAATKADYPLMPGDQKITVYPGSDDSETKSFSSVAEWETYLATQPNAVAVVEASDAANAFAAATKNIIVHTTGEVGGKTVDVYACPKLVLEDTPANKEKRNFYAPVDFTAQTGTYTRNLSANYNTCCVPFVLNNATISIADDNYKLLVFYGYKLENGQKIAVFNDYKELSAQTPCLIYCSKSAKLTATFNSTDIKKDIYNDSNMKGTYVKTNEWATAQNTYSLVSDGSHFASQPADYVYPFRAVLDMSKATDVTQNAPARSVNINLEDLNKIVTDVEETASVDATEKFLQNGKLYIRKNGQVFNVEGQLVK